MSGNVRLIARTTERSSAGRGTNNFGQYDWPPAIDEAPLEGRIERYFLGAARP
jgi:hypothetical protein